MMIILQLSSHTESSRFSAAGEVARTKWAAAAMRRSRLGLIALGMAMVVYLGFLLRHFHEPGSSNNGLQQLVRTQAADITRLKQQLAILQNRVSSAPAAVPCSIPSSTAAPSQHADGTMLSSQPKLLPLEFTEGENFLLATRAEVDGTTAAADSSRVVRGLLSSARFLKRTLLLPPGPLSSKLLATPLASELLALGVRVRPAANLTAPLAEEVKCSHVRIETPHGLDSEQFVHALRHYATTRILEIDLPHESYCGPSARASSSLVEAERALDMIVQRAAGGVGAAPHAPTATSLLGRCHHSLKEEEVSQYWDMGKCKGHRVRVALPEAITRLPRGSDLMVTFSTGGVATMAHNWVEALRRAGVTEGILIGALDQPMRDECARRGLPCVAVAGDNSTTSQLSKCREKNIRMCPAQYPKMSILKVGFYRELLSLGFNVFACDADAIFMNDPRPLMRIEPWVHAEVAIATDCIDLPGDAWRPLLHCDFNTGLVFMRGASQAVLDFTETWREKVANAKEARIRDQVPCRAIPPPTPSSHLSFAPLLRTSPSHLSFAPLLPSTSA